MALHHAEIGAERDNLTKSISRFVKEFMILLLPFLTICSRTPSYKGFGIGTDLVTVSQNGSRTPSYKGFGILKQLVIKICVNLWAATGYASHRAYGKQMKSRPEFASKTDTGLQILALAHENSCHLTE